MESDTECLIPAETASTDVVVGHTSSRPGCSRGSALKVATVVVLVAVVATAFAVSQKRLGLGLARSRTSSLIVEAEKVGPYDAWHIDHGTQDHVNSRTGVPYSLKHGKGEEIGNYMVWADAQEAAHGGAWMITYQEDGKEYLCKTSPGPDTEISGPDTYDGYWKPVYEKLSSVHDIIFTSSSQQVCQQRYALLHVKHGSEVTSPSGVGYAVGHVVSRAGSWAAASKLTAGGAWMLTKQHEGKQYLCKTYPGPDTRISSGDTYAAYWAPVFDGLCKAHDILNGVGNADICAAS